ncbi:MAG: hypothetical protein GY811_05050 [Myxococcales bacterium]|nr:hypothetical protein [Myxococcales bacterium]
MIRNTLLLTTLFASCAALAGCNLYFEDSDFGEPPQRRGQSEGWVPDSCQTNEQCGDGCYCTANGTCEESSFCEESYECAEGFECDYRDSCVPGDEPEPEPAVTCQSEVGCDEIAPICPAGTAASIEDGCYTGVCMAKADCPDGAPFECSDLNADESACIADATCGPVYVGVNCTSTTGAECTSAGADCSCESFEFDYCE